MAKPGSSCATAPLKEPSLVICIKTSKQVKKKKADRD